MKRLALAVLVAALASPITAETVHVVQPGENLSLIAQRDLGSSRRAGEIARMNALANPNVLRVGQLLRLPSSTSDSTGHAADIAASALMSLTTTHISASPEAQELAVVDMTGGLEVMRNGEEINVSNGTKLRAGDSLRVSGTGRALLAGMNGERLELSGGATALVRELSSTFEDRRLVLRLDAGRLRISAPVTPFLARYLIECPIGSISLRSGDALINVTPPGLATVSTWDGRIVVNVPRGGRELSAGQGGVFRTTELPPPVTALPASPGLSVESTARSVIAAAATLPGNSVQFNVYADRDLQRLVTGRRVPADELGLATVRFELGPGTWWLAISAIDSKGLESAPSLPPPIRLTSS